MPWRSVALAIRRAHAARLLLVRDDMKRDLVREAEIEQDIVYEPRGEMAVVADSDPCGDDPIDEEEPLPDTVRDVPHASDEESVEGDDVEDASRTQRPT